MSDSAIVMFERYTATPYFSRQLLEQDPTFLTGMYKRPGELYEARNYDVKAAINYRKFVSLWKDADLDL